MPVPAAPDRAGSTGSPTRGRRSTCPARATSSCRRTVSVPEMSVVPIPAHSAHCPRSRTTGATSVATPRENSTSSAVAMAAAVVTSQATAPRKFWSSRHASRSATASSIGSTTSAKACRTASGIRRGPSRGRNGSRTSTMAGAAAGSSSETVSAAAPRPIGQRTTSPGSSTTLSSRTRRRTVSRSAPTEEVRTGSSTPRPVTTTGTSRLLRSVSPAPSTHASRTKPAGTAPREVSGLHSHSTGPPAADVVGSRSVPNRARRRTRRITSGTRTPAGPRRRRR